MKTKDLNKVIEGCLEGNDKYRKAFYMLISSHMLSVSHRYARNRTDAEDIFQESILKTFNNLQQLKDIEKLEWWTKKIVINEAIQFYNKSKRLSFVEEYVPQLQESADFSAEVFVSLELAELHEIIRFLPDKMRLIINLYAIEGYSHEEIAAMLDISVGTSKSNLFDARKKIKQLLTEKERGTK